MSRAVILAGVGILTQAGAALAQEVFPSTGHERYLAGRLCTFSGGSPYASSSYSRSSWAVFDGRGSYQYGSETAFSSGAGLGYGGGPQGAGSYRIQGNMIYLIDSDGTVETATVHMRQNDGRITEVMYQGDLYAAQLCQ